MTASVPCSRQPKHLDAGTFQTEINSFALRLAAEGKAAKTIRTYTEAVQWFAAARLQVGRTNWEQVTSRDIQRWMAWLLTRTRAARPRRSPFLSRPWPTGSGCWAPTTPRPSPPRNNLAAAHQGGGSHGQGNRTESSDP